MRQFSKISLMVLAICLSVSLGAMNVYGQPLGIMSAQAEQPQLRILASAKGRFVFGQISDSGKDQFMLDTFTGRLWRIAETGRIGLFLESVPYHISEKEYSSLPGDVQETQPKTSD